MNARTAGRSLAVVLSLFGACPATRAQNANTTLAQNDAARRLDEKLKAASPPATASAVDACAGLSAAGFKLTCGKLIPFGALLGAVPVSQTATDLADCARRCRIVPKCVAFSYDAGAAAGNHACYLTGSVDRYQDGKDWIAGTR